MAYHGTGHHTSDDLHPAIYKALVGLAAWMMVAAWIFFGTTGYYASFSVAVATGLFLMAIAIPAILWRVWRRNSPASEVRHPPIAFSDWWHGKDETWQGPVEGWDAAVEVLLPLGVAALGMTAIGLIFRLTAGG